VDWHIVHKCAPTSKGWTGYTWDIEYFPNPEQFLEDCHSQNLKVYLNLHPADGCHSHEKEYLEFAKMMNFTPESIEKSEPIQFDLTNPKFIEGYFKHLHHPHEDIGIDFWWIDWQQLNKCKNFRELDPLWYLNHLHTIDFKRRNTRRPLILSRWGGFGNHRYPVGFSGDTQATWSTLEVLPEFTSTAANELFLWSHDVGGFMWGENDGELYLRWVQFSVLLYGFI